MDSLRNFCKADLGKCVAKIFGIVKVNFLAAENAGFIDKASHFTSRAAVAKLQVIEHGIVLLCKTLISSLYQADIRTHLVCVVRHVNNCRISIFDRFCRISAERGNERSGKTRCRFHVFVCRHSGCFVSVVCVFQRFVLRRSQFFILGASSCNCLPLLLCKLLKSQTAVAEERFNAADKLFIAGIRLNCVLCNLANGCTCSGDTCNSRRAHNLSYFADSL